MSYSFGWWDFDDSSEPQMICGDTDERVVMVGALPEPWLGKAISLHPEVPKDRWNRFEYRHADFWFPLIVNWCPEKGKVLIDYNLSSELWRQETNVEAEYPPYGGWVRVDDMVPDAFWCWPGFLEGYLPKTIAEGSSKDWFNSVKTVGSYLNCVWERQKASSESINKSEAGLFDYAEYLYSDLAGKPFPCFFYSSKYDKAMCLDQINKSIQVAHVYDRMFFLGINASADTWHFELGSESAMRARSTSGKTLKRGQFDRLMTHGGNMDAARSTYFFPDGTQVPLLFGCVIPGPSSSGWQVEDASRIAEMYFQYNHVYESGYPEYSWWRENYGPTSISQFHREFADAASCSQWEKLFSLTEFLPFDACLTATNFLGGIYFAYKARFTKFGAKKN